MDQHIVAHVSIVENRVQKRHCPNEHSIIQFDNTYSQSGVFLSHNPRVQGLIFIGISEVFNDLGATNSLSEDTSNWGSYVRLSALHSKAGGRFHLYSTFTLSSLSHSQTCMSTDVRLSIKTTTDSVIICIFQASKDGVLNAAKQLVTFINKSPSPYHGKCSK